MYECVCGIYVFVQNENIIILKADKGRATVVLDKEDYIKNCTEHLTSEPYTKLKKDPTSSIVSKVTKELIELRDNNLIEQQEYFKLKPTGKQPPRFYDLRSTRMEPHCEQSYHTQELRSTKYQNTLQIY